MDTDHAPLLKRLVTKSAIWEVSSTFSNRTSAEGLKNLATAISATPSPKSLWGTRSLDITDKLKPSIKSHLSASKSQVKITFLPGNPCWLTLDTLGWLMQLHLLTHQIHKFHQIPPGIAVPNPEEPLFDCWSSSSPSDIATTPKLQEKTPGARERGNPELTRSIQTCVFKHKKKLDSPILSQRLQTFQLPKQELQKNP